jgi:hypothetical protein
MYRCYSEVSTILRYLGQYPSEVDVVKCIIPEVSKQEHAFVLEHISIRQHCGVPCYIVNAKSGVPMCVVGVNEGCE